MHTHQCSMFFPFLLPGNQIKGQSCSYCPSILRERAARHRPLASESLDHWTIDSWTYCCGRKIDPVGLLKVNLGFLLPASLTKVVVSIMKRNSRKPCKMQEQEPYRILIQWEQGLSLSQFPHSSTWRPFRQAFAHLLSESATALSVMQGNVYCMKTKSRVLISIWWSQSHSDLYNKDNLCLCHRVHGGI